MYFLSDAYRLREAIKAERAEDRAKVAAAPAQDPAVAHTPVAAPKRPVFSLGDILRFPRGLHALKAK